MGNRPTTAVLHEPYVTQTIKRLSDTPAEWLDDPARTPLEAVLRIWPGWDLAIPQAWVHPYQPFTFVTYPLRRGDHWAAVPFLALDWDGDANQPGRRRVTLMKHTEAAAVSKDLTALTVHVLAPALGSPTAAKTVDWWQRLWTRHHPQETLDSLDLLVSLSRTGGGDKPAEPGEEP